MIHQISSTEFCQRIGCSLPNFRLMLKKQQLPRPRKIGRKLFWLSEVADAWIIQAFDYPLPMPYLPPELRQEVEEAIRHLKQDRDKT